MKKLKLLKLAAAAVIFTGFVAGCASESEPMAEAKDCPNAEAKNAIYQAKVRNSQAKKVGYEWRDTGKIIKAAEKAATKCENDKAVKLAHKATKQADDAIAQYESETKRFEQNQGSVEAAPMMMAKEEPVAMQATVENNYEVVSGDNLWNISGKPAIYGNPYRWPLIYKANSDQIKDADLIFAGQVFTIPEPNSDEVSAAIAHARNRGAWTLGETEASDNDYLAQ